MEETKDNVIAIDSATITQTLRHTGPHVLDGEDAKRFLTLVKSQAKEPTPRMREAMANYERFMGRSIKIPPQ